MLISQTHKDNGSSTVNTILGAVGRTDVIFSKRGDICISSSYGFLADGDDEKNGKVKSEEDEGRWNATLLATRAILCSGASSTEIGTPAASLLPPMRCSI